MFNVFGDLNVLAIVLAVVAAAVLGGVWYTALFAKPYATSLGKTTDTLDNSAPIFIAGPLLCNLVVVIASAVLIEALGIDAIGDAIAFGFIVGIGFLAATTVNIAINPNIPRPLFYGLISGAYNIVVGVVISVILVAIG